MIRKYHNHNHQPIKWLWLLPSFGVILLLVIYYFIAPVVLVCHLHLVFFCDVVINVLSRFEIILPGEVIWLLFLLCSWSHMGVFVFSALGLSVICICGISRSY